MKNTLAREQCEVTGAAAQYRKFVKPQVIIGYRMPNTAAWRSRYQSPAEPSTAPPLGVARYPTYRLISNVGITFYKESCIALILIFQISTADLPIVRSEEPSRLLLVAIRLWLTKHNPIFQKPFTQRNAYVTQSSSWWNAGRGHEAIQCKLYPLHSQHACNVGC